MEITIKIPNNKYKNHKQIKKLLDFLYDYFKMNKMKEGTYEIVISKKGYCLAV